MPGIGSNDLSFTKSKIQNAKLQIATHHGFFKHAYKPIQWPLDLHTIFFCLCLNGEHTGVISVIVIEILGHEVKLKDLKDNTKH